MQETLQRILETPWSVELSACDTNGFKKNKRRVWIKDVTFSTERVLSSVALIRN